MNYEICVIGNNALVFPFLQFGFKSYVPTSEKALREYLQQAISDNFGIIYIEDSYCFMVSDILDRYKDKLTPIFVPIGAPETGESFSKKKISELMTKAVGMDIF